MKINMNTKMNDIKLKHPPLEQGEYGPKYLSLGENPKKRIPKRVIILFLAIIIIIASVAFAVNFYFKAKKLEAEKLESAPQDSAEENTQKIIEEVSNLILLPTDEVPTVATVQDPSKLRGQQFFANAKEGYKVLIYTKAGKAILYDPVNKIIVEVAPLNTSSGQEQAQ